MDAVKEVTAAIIIREGRVLIARRKSDETLGGFWEFPGGAIRAGETPQACLERELAEELGVAARAGGVLAVSEYRYAHGMVRLIGIAAEIEAGKIMLTAHDRLAWVPIGDLGRYRLSPADIPIAERLREIYSGG